MSKVVRSSKYRHVFGTAWKQELCWDNLKPTRNAWDSNFVHANRTFLAVLWHAEGGGSFAVLPLDKPGKYPSDIPLVCGHKAAVLDVEFNPFNENLVASASEDGLVMIWNIPDGGLTAPMRDPVQRLIGHKRKVGQVKHHPIANNVLASSSTDFVIKIWDIEKGASTLEIGDHTNIIQDIAWNMDGSLMATSCKDKKLRFVDPRTSKVVGDAVAHEGVKGMRLCWLGKSGKVYTSGFSKTSDRQYAIWDQRNLSAPVCKDDVDSAAGLLMPFFDVDTGVLFLAGKGDGNIRYYEGNDDFSELYYLSEFKSAVPARGLCMMPKVSLKINECEIVRMMRVDTHMVQPISFNVPRKSEMFQDDLFPPTFSWEPSLTSEEWFAGKNAEPKTVSLEKGFVPADKPKTEFKPEVKTEDEGPQDEKALRDEWKKQKTRIAYLEAELAKAQALAKGN